MPLLQKLLVVISLLMPMAIAALLGIVIWQSPERGKTLIEVVRLVTSWPVVVAALTFAAGLTFHRELKGFLNRLALFRFPGGELVASAEQSKPESDIGDKPEEGTIQLTPQQQEEVRQYVQTLEDKLVGTQQERETLLTTAADMLNQKEREILYWRFEYLFLFLVPMTQLVLRWFSQQPMPVTKEYFEEKAKQSIPDAEQRETILMVLLHHELLTQNGITLTVTDAGRQFLTYLTAKQAAAPPGAA